MDAYELRGFKVKNYLFSVQNSEINDKTLLQISVAISDPSSRSSDTPRPSNVKPNSFSGFRAPRRLDLFFLELMVVFC